MASVSSAHSAGLLGVVVLPSAVQQPVVKLAKVQWRVTPSISMAHSQLEVSSPPPQPLRLMA
eukprot:CAMPEP_0197673550 /NCGR_PEP_ID=MMETSP1338-20131121/81177_1 /TAXON_ID=43686 ORGANISM="Pelagodinium beii, Strain RCC1491" /NCGR_SAMPLE_ID=MMETSP1338 /ASSEMBLY_ACC=CAM_ASM_000754 /LENGTH=61 /DNA_ID=CAMNT_0043253817 /DNA_START=279 /DNA_END=461 /DNA_ORIENTATION=+